MTLVCTVEKAVLPSSADAPEAHVAALLVAEIGEIGDGSEVVGALALGPTKGVGLTDQTGQFKVAIWPHRFTLDKSADYVARPNGHVYRLGDRIPGGGRGMSDTRTFTNIPEDCHTEDQEVLAPGERGLARYWVATPSTA